MAWSPVVVGWRLGALGLLASGSGPAWAQAPASTPAVDARSADAAPTGPEVARARYTAGVAAFRDRRLDEAAGHFAAAYAADPAPVLLYNLARSLEEQGKAAEAAARFEQYLSRYPGAADAADVARRLPALQAVARGTAPGRLAIDQLPADATVFVDDRPQPSALDARWTVPNGARAVRIERPGFEPLRAVVQVRPGADATLAYVPTPPLPGPTVVEVLVPAPAGPPFPVQKVLGWSLVGLGLATVGVGAFTALAAGDSLAEFDALSADLEGRAAGPETDADLARRASLRDDHERHTTTTYVLWGAGGALLAGGVTLVVLDALDGPAPEGEVSPSGAEGGPSVRLGVLPHWVGLSGTF